MQSDAPRSGEVNTRRSRRGEPAIEGTQGASNGPATQTAPAPRVPRSADGTPMTRAQLRAAAAAAAAMVDPSPVAGASFVSVPASVAAAADGIPAGTPAQRDAADALLAEALRALDAAPARRRAPQIAYMPTPMRAPDATVPVKSDGSRRGIARKVAAASFSAGVMGIVGLFALATTAPAEALAAATGDSTSSVVQSLQAPATQARDLQTYVAAGDVETTLDRTVDSYSMQSMADVAAESGITKPSNVRFSNDTSASIQWPFAVGVPITDTWGPRWGTFHHGVDFTPGIGADIQAVADGTVRIATDSGGLYGSYVVIDHVIDGQQVSSLYAHMLTGSIKVKVGQKVTVGTVLGNTGDTGFSTGPHTHFEITLNGTRIDPLPWLQANAGRHL